MERELEEEWQRLEEKATAILNQPPGRDGVLLYCHAVILPSFDDCRSYSIFGPALASSAPALGVRRVWRRRDDLLKFDSPITRLRYSAELQPTIDEQDVVLPTQEVDGILQRAATATVPPCIREQIVGTDGESYVLSFGDLFVSTRFEWWSQPPEGWEPLETLFKDIVRAVENGLT